MSRKKLRILALSLAALAVVAGLAAFFTSSDLVTNAFKASTLEIKLREPLWENEPTIVPQKKVDKNPYIENTDETAAYVFMKVTVPAEKLVIEKNSGEDKGEKLGEITAPLFRFIDKDGNYTTDQTSTDQKVNTGWYLMNTPEIDKADESISYLYAWVGNNGDDTMAVLEPEGTTGTLFDKVIFCNAREDSELSGSLKNIKIEVFGIQKDYLKSSDETETKAKNVWAHLAG